MVAYLPSQFAKISTNVLVQNLPGNTPFLLLFLVFLVAPTRLLTERGVANARRTRPIRTFSRPVTYGGFAVLGAVLLLVPTFVPNAEMTQYASTLGYLILFGQQQRIDVPRPEILGVDFTKVVPFYYLCLAVAVLAGAVVLAVRASRLGGLLRAMSDSPTALAAHGANTTLIKVVVFCISA